MRFEQMTIPDVVLITPRVFTDARGFFMETWQKKEFSENGIDYEFCQDNHSKSSKDVLRGMHYQIKQPQGKLVRVVTGEIFDAVVDIRRSSPYFGKWTGSILSESNHNMLWVPPGFAHGFFVLSETAEIVYKATDYYAPQYERSIRWDDPQIAIKWPIDGITPLLSERDNRATAFCEAEVYL